LSTTVEHVCGLTEGAGASQAALRAAVALCQRHSRDAAPAAAQAFWFGLLQAYVAPLRALRGRAAVLPQAVQPSPPTPPLERALVQPAAAAAGAAMETGHLRQGGYGSPAPDQAKSSAPAAPTEAAVAAAQGALAALLEKAIGAMAGHVPLQARARPRALPVLVGRAGPPRALPAEAPRLAGPGCKGSRCCCCSAALLRLLARPLPQSRAAHPREACTRGL